VVNVDFLVALLVGDVVEDGLMVVGGSDEEDDFELLELIDDGLELGVDDDNDVDFDLASKSRAAMEAVDDEVVAVVEEDDLTG